MIARLYRLFTHDVAQAGAGRQAGKKDTGHKQAGKKGSTGSAGRATHAGSTWQHRAAHTGSTYRQHRQEGSTGRQEGMQERSKPCREAGRKAGMKEVREEG